MKSSTYLKGKLSLGNQKETERHRGLSALIFRRDSNTALKPPTKRTVITLCDTFIDRFNPIVLASLTKKEKEGMRCLRESEVWR